MRVILGCVAAVLVAALGGLIMGEYALLGVMALVAGLLFGLAVAEVAIAVGASSGWPLVITAGVSAGLGLTWAASIEAGDSLSRIAGLRWAGSLLALLTAAWWVRTLGSRGARSQPEPESPLSES